MDINTEFKRGYSDYNDYSLEAEQGVLGAVLVQPGLYRQAAQIVESGDFIAGHNRAVFEAVGEIYGKTGDLDLIALLENLAAKLPNAGREELKAEILRLADCVLAVGNIADYCRIVKAKSTARLARGIAREAYEAGFYRGGSDETAAAIQEAAEKLADLARDKNKRGARKLNAILGEVWLDIFGDGEDLSLKTGIGTLDGLLDGIYPGDLVVIAAGTSVGKTAFALQIIKNMARQGKRIMLYSQEMTDKQNALRFIARQAGVELWRLKKPGRLDESEAKLVSAAFDELYKLPIEIRDTGGVTVEEIRLDCVGKRAGGGTDAIFIDHVGLMRGHKGAKSRTEEVSRIMVELRALALQAQVPIIALAQFNREGQKFSAEPTLLGFKDSSEIEQSASTAILMWRTEDWEADKIIGVKVAKNRQGETGRLYMKFDAPRMNFWEVVQYTPKRGAPYTKEVEEVFG